MSTALAVQEKSDMQSFIERAAMTEGFDILKFEKLIGMKQQMDAEQRKAEFFEALARVQAVMPRVKQTGMIDYGSNKTKIAYAKFEDIDAAVRPIYAAEGFSVTWNTEEAGPDGKMVRVIGEFSRGGHSERRQLTLPADTSGGKTGVQAVPSTVAYGKRQISKMFWNIIEEGLDKDGANANDLQPVTQDQVDNLCRMLNGPAAEARMRTWLRVNTFMELTQGGLKKALEEIERRRAEKATR